MGWNITTDKIGNVYFMNRFGMMESLLPDNESFEFYFSTALSGEKIVSHCVSKKILGLQFHPEVSRRSAYQIIEKIFTMRIIGELILSKELDAVKTTQFQNPVYCGDYLNISKNLERCGYR